MIAIIPARGGSKRIPGKNIKIFSGKPIIQYSIEAAKQSKLFKRILVSTDSPEIAAMAKTFGAEAPFLRPPAISDDQAGLADVIAHALENLGIKPGDAAILVCCILATAPFVTAESLTGALKLLEESGASTVVPVTTFPYPIHRALKLSADHSFKMFWPEHEKSRSNDLPEAYHDAGQFYWLNSAKFLQTKRLFQEDSKAFVLPRYLVHDIDTPEDWKTAELAFRALENRKGHDL